MAKRIGELDVGTDIKNADKLIVQQAGVDNQVVASELPVPLNYIAGLITSNDAIDLDHDIAIAVGIARSADDSETMRLLTILTKQIDATWAVGDDAGGMESAFHPVQANTAYALWLIKRSDSGVVDAMFSESFTAPTLPASYDSKRLIGFVRTDGTSDIFAYTQVGDFFRYDDVHLEVSDTTMVAGTWESQVLVSAPPSSLAKVRTRYAAPNIAGPSMRFALRPNGALDSNIHGDIGLDSAADNTEDLNLKTEVFCPADQTIEYMVSGSTPGAGHQFQLWVYGFEMYTRRDP